MRSIPRDLYRLFERLTPYERGAVALDELLTRGRERELTALCRGPSSRGTVRWMELSLAVAAVAQVHALHALALAAYSEEGSGKRWKRACARKAAAWLDALERLGRETGFPLSACRRALGPGLDEVLPEPEDVPDDGEEYVALRRVWDAGGGSDAKDTGRELPRVPEPAAAPEDPSLFELRTLEGLALEEAGKSYDMAEVVVFALPDNGRLDEGEEPPVDLSKLSPRQVAALRRELELERPVICDMSKVDPAQLARFIIAESAESAGRGPRRCAPKFLFPAVDPEDRELAERWMDFAFPSIITDLQGDQALRGRPWNHWAYGYDEETWKASLETEKVEPWPESDEERAERERREKMEKLSIRSAAAFRAAREDGDGEEEARDVSGADMLDGRIRAGRSAPGSPKAEAGASMEPEPPAAPAEPEAAKAPESPPEPKRKPVRVSGPSDAEVLRLLQRQQGGLGGFRRGLR